MRKLAPMFLTTTILAFAAGNVLANADYKTKQTTTSSSSLSTSATDQATPPGNSDSSTAGAMKAGEPAARSTVSPAASPTVPANTQNPQGMSYSDKSSSAPGTNAKMDSNSEPVTTATTTTHKVKKAKKKVAKADTTLPAPQPSATNADAAGSTTGRSPGGTSQ